MSETKTIKETLKALGIKPKMLEHLQGMTGFLQRTVLHLIHLLTGAT